MFVPLVVRSAYSLHYGTRMPADVVKRLRGLGYHALALTDRNNLYGVHEFLDACKEEGVRPLIGATILAGGQEVVVLVKERKGFSNLCRLLTRRTRLGSSFSLAEEVPLHAEGNAVLCRDSELLERWQGKVEDLSVWIEGLDRSRYRLALRLGLPAVAAPEVLFHEPEDVETHQALQAIERLGPIATGALSTGGPVSALGNTPVTGTGRGDKRTIGNRPLATRPVGDRPICEGRCFPPDNRGAPFLPRFPAPPQEVEAWFAPFPEAVENAGRLAERCRFREIFQGFVFPPLPTLDKGRDGIRGEAWAEKGFLSYAGKGNDQVARELRERVLRGAEERYGEVSEGVLERIDYEISIIEQKGFAGYFLVVADIVKRSPRTCGRGSGAASVVSYCLGITNVDPIRHNLYFERFLNPERVDPPDIDVDFAWDERDGVIEDVFRQYGEERCARVCNHVFYRFRSALRETARAFGIPEGEIGAFEKRLRHEGREAGRARETPEGSDSGREGGGYAEPWPTILRIAQRITGLPRHLGVHSGGVVITPEPIDTYVPVERAEKGVPIVTWEKDGVEAAGLVKIDLLGNRSLAVIRDALEQVRKNGGVVGEGFKDPTTDPATQGLLARGDTIGVFYVESPAMRQLQAKTGKGDFEHLVIHSSIIRPAANRFINLYVRRLKGEPYEPLHPDLDRILSETYGILCYQEDVSKAAIVLAGFSNADADGLRKILSKKNKETRLARYKEQFYQGAARRGIPTLTIDAVWDMILSFEGYSFCKPHSASYAMVSFQSAYLKAHHPAEFMAAVLSNRGGYYTPAAYVSEARRMGLTILGPDVNQSQYAYVGKGREVRVGFVEVKGLRRETVDAILSERARAPFRSVEDFARRVELVEEDAEALVSVGALDSVAGGRSRVEQLWALLKTVASKGRGGQKRGVDLSDELFASGKSAGPRASNRLSLSDRRRREREYERLGFLVEGHPLSLWVPATHRRVRGKELPTRLNQWVEIVGWPVTSKEILTREGKPMEFVSFEDETAIYETVLFPKAYERYARLLDEPRPYVIRGWVREDLGAVSIHVEDLSPLPSWKNRKER